MAGQVTPNVYFDFDNISSCDELSVPTDKHLILSNIENPLCPTAPAVIYSEIDDSVEYMPIIKWLTAGTITVTNEVGVPITNAAIVIRLGVKNGNRDNLVIKGSDTIETLSGATNTYTLRIPDNIVEIVENSDLAKTSDPTVTLAFLTNGTISGGVVQRNISSPLCLNYSGRLYDDGNVGIYGFGPANSLISEASPSCQMPLTDFIMMIKEGPDSFGEFMLIQDTK